MPTFVTVATTDELGLGGAKQVHVDGKTLALFNVVPHLRLSSSMAQTHHMLTRLATGLWHHRV